MWRYTVTTINSLSGEKTEVNHDYRTFTEAKLVMNHAESIHKRNTVTKINEFLSVFTSVIGNTNKIYTITRVSDSEKGSLK